MKKQDYKEIIKKHKEFVMAYDLKMKQLTNIMVYIAPDCEAEDVVAFFDWGTIFKIGKYGIFISMDAVYFRISDKDNVLKMDFEGLTKVSLEKVNYLLSNLYFEYKDGRRLGYQMALLHEESVVEMLNEIAVKYNNNIQERKEVLEGREKERREREDENNKVIITDQCLGCLACADACPIGAIRAEKGMAYVNQDECVQCGECEIICPAGAIRMGRR